MGDIIKFPGSKVEYGECLTCNPDGSWRLEVNITDVEAARLMLMAAETNRTLGTQVGQCVGDEKDWRDIRQAGYLVLVANPQTDLVEEVIFPYPA